MADSGRDDEMIRLSHPSLSHLDAVLRSFELDLAGAEFDTCACGSWRCDVEGVVDPRQLHSVARRGIDVAFAGDEARGTER